MREAPEPFFARTKSTGDQVVLELGGEWDASTLDELNETFRELLQTQPREVVVDLAEVTFVDSLTLGALMAAATQLQARGASLRVVRASAPEVRRAFEVTGLDKYLIGVHD
jgi:anti-sigma B factor antagonist